MKKFAPGTPLYVRPMYWAERAGPMALPPDPESTRWCLALYDTPMRKPEGFSVTLSPFRRPTIETAPVDAKAGCLYPNNARAMFEAKSRGFDNCIVCDMLGNVAELANSNVFMAKDGVVFTPMPNGTFLNGITRQRVIKLMREAGISVVETDAAIRAISRRADEIFATGNASKVHAGHPHRRARAAARPACSARRGSSTGPSRTTVVHERDGHAPGAGAGDPGRGGEPCSRRGRRDADHLRIGREHSPPRV